MQAFADNKIDLSENFKFVLGKVENIVGKGNKRTMMVLYRSPEY